jgi:hypothetical protein
MSPRIAESADFPGALWKLGPGPSFHRDARDVAHSASRARVITPHRRCLAARRGGCKGAGRHKPFNPSVFNRCAGTLSWRRCFVALHALHPRFTTRNMPHTGASRRSWRPSICSPHCCATQRRGTQSRMSRMNRMTGLTLDRDEQMCALDESPLTSASCSTRSQDASCLSCSSFHTVRRPMRVDTARRSLRTGYAPRFGGFLAASRATGERIRKTFSRHLLMQRTLPSGDPAVIFERALRRNRVSRIPSREAVRRRRRGVGCVALTDLACRERSAQRVRRCDT